MRKNIQLGYGNEIPPSTHHVKVYMLEKGFCSEEIGIFIKTMSLLGWKTNTGNTIKNWKAFLFQCRYILKHPPNKYIKRQSSINQKLK